MLEESEAPVDIPRAPRPEFLTATRFDAFNLPAEVLKGLAEAGFEYCTPIQAEALPLLLRGGDVAGQAHTGTGKTAAFLVTVISRLLGFEDRKTGLPQAIIMAPTRELSRQIFEEAQVLSRHTDITLLEVVGGVDYKEQAEGLQKGADIVIGTPGRIIDYYKQGILKTREIKFLVIDEADRLLDLGFEKDMRFILRKLPQYEKRQSMLFSATLSYRVLELTYEFMNLPEFISVIPDQVTVAGIEQSLFHVGSDRKFQLLLGLLQREDYSRMLIFVNMKISVERLTRRLKGNGIPAEGISGDLPQQKRFKLMERFKDGQIKILIATDVASRGIHVEDISHVINYDIPQDSENYVHRIGRTARAGKTGKAISLACEEYVFHLEPLESMLGYKIPVVWADEDWYQEDRSKPEDRASFDRRDRKNGRRGRDHDRDRDRGRGRGRAPRRPSDDAAPAKPKAKRIPGAFFGFGPEAEEPVPEPADAEAEVSENTAPESPAAAVEEVEKVDKPKKRRRRRRKKRTSAPESGPATPASAEPEEAPASPPPLEPAE
jgi:ATP-dependent RNA helicase RhlB